MFENLPAVLIVIAMALALPMFIAVYDFRWLLREWRKDKEAAARAAANAA